LHNSNFSRSSWLFHHKFDTYRSATTVFDWFGSVWLLVMPKRPKDHSGVRDWGGKKESKKRWWLYWKVTIWHVSRIGKIVGISVFYREGITLQRVKLIYIKKIFHFTNKFTLRVEIIKMYYRNSESVTSTLVSHTSFSSVGHLCDEFWEKILAYIFYTNWRKNWSRDWCSNSRFMLENRQKMCPWWPCKRNRVLYIKPSTHIDENRQLTIGVSERQLRGYSFSSGFFSSRYSDEEIPDLASEFRWTPLAATQRIRNVIFGGVRAKAVWKLKIKNWRKTPKTPAEGQCRWKRTPNPRCWPLLWDFTGRKQYHNRANPDGVDALEDPSGISLSTWTYQTCPRKVQYK